MQPARQINQSPACAVTGRMNISADALAKAAAPLIDLLRSKGHPHLSAIVTAGGVRLVADEINVPTPERLSHAPEKRARRADFSRSAPSRTQTRVSR